MQQNHNEMIYNDIDQFPTVLDNKYYLGKALGEGGYSTVYQAVDMEGNPCAVKVQKR